MRTRRAWVAAAALPAIGAVAVLSALTVGNSKQEVTVQASAAPGSISAEVRVDDSQPVSPLDLFADGSGITREAADRVEARTQSCMADRGWKYSPNPNVLGLSEPVTVGALRAYRATSGYGIADKPSVRPVDPNQPLVQGLSSADQERWNRDLSAGGEEGGATRPGPPGCRTQALSELLTSTPMANPQVRAKVAEARSRVAGHPEIVAAIEAWRSCMASKGFPNLATVPAARTMLRNEATSATDRNSLKEKELRLATSDFSCQEQTILGPLQRIESEAVAQLKSELPRS